MYIHAYNYSSMPISNIFNIGDRSADDNVLPAIMYKVYIYLYTYVHT